MKRRRHTSKQSFLTLREVDRLLGGVTLLVKVPRNPKVTEASPYRGRNHRGGMTADDAKSLKDLEKENAPLKRLATEEALDPG